MTRTYYGVVLKTTSKRPNIKFVFLSWCVELLKIVTLINTPLNVKDNYDWFISHECHFEKYGWYFPQSEKKIKKFLKVQDNDIEWKCSIQKHSGFKRRWRNLERVNFATKMTFTSTVVVGGCTSSSEKVFTSFTDWTSC